MNDYADVLCDNLGGLNMTAAKLHIKPYCVPKCHKASPVSFAIKEALGQEIDYLEAEGILENVEHCEWAAPVVAVPKNGQLRVCGNLKVTVNPVLVIENYPLPKPEDLMINLAGGLRFSKFNLTQAYFLDCIRPIVTQVLSVSWMIF